MNRYKLKDISMSKLEYGSGAAACEYDGKTRYVRITDIDNEGNLGPDVVSPNSVDDKYLLNEGDVLFARTGATVGKTYLYRSSAGRCIYAGFLIRVVPNQEIIRSDYLYYFTKSLQYKEFVQSSMKVVAQPNINAKQYGDLEFNVPSLEEQDSIIKRLNAISSVMALRKTELQRLDELIKARFVELFGDIGAGVFNYQTYKLGDVAKVGSSHRVFTTEFVESGIPFYRGTEIGELANGKKPSDPYYISKKHYEQLANDETKPLVGDLLMPSICNKGQVWMVDTEEPFYYKDGRVLCISPDREVFNSKFLQYFMREKTLVEYPKMGSGSTFAEFKIFLLKDMDVLIPPKEIQEKFADFVKATDKSKFQESIRFHACFPK